jgi:hypothetical protein
MNGYLYVIGPFMMGRSVMFSIREGHFVNGYLLHGYAIGPSMIGRSVMFSIREDLAYWTDYTDDTFYLLSVKQRYI